MHVEHATAQQALAGELVAFMADLCSMDDADLLVPSRCLGWSRCDLAAHVHMGLQEILLGVHSPSASPPDTDAASYWRAVVPTNDSGADRLDALRFAQRLALVYRRPSGLARHMEATAAPVGRAVISLAPAVLAFQGHVMATGDFLAMWAVELCIHHLDLAPGDGLDGPTPESLALTRSTVEALAGGPFPAGLDDSRVALIGAGRDRPTPGEVEALGSLAAAVPVIT